MNREKESATVLFAMIAEYADWEPALLAAGLCKGFGLWEPKYTLKTVAISRNPVLSIGGFRTIPDYTFADAPSDFAALILIGGTNWFGDEARAVLPLVHKAVEREAVVGAICDASVFLGVHGFLNTVRHTSNGLAAIKERAGTAYTGESLYRDNTPSVRDNNLITANGAGFIEFARNVFEALEVAPQEKLEAFYRFCKTGMFTA